MPLSARKHRTFDPRPRVKLPPGARRAAASALAVLAVAGAASGCAAASTTARRPRPRERRARQRPARPPAGLDAELRPFRQRLAGDAGVGRAGRPAPPAEPPRRLNPAPGPARPRRSRPSSSSTPATAGSRARAGSWPPATAAAAGPGSTPAGPTSTRCDFIDGQHGWAAGGGTLLRTTDGGASWTALAEPCQGELNSVHFVSATLGFAVGSQAGDEGGGQRRRRPVHDRPRRLAAAHQRRRLDLDAGHRARPPTRRAPASPTPMTATSAPPAHIWRTTDGGAALDAGADRAGRVRQPDARPTARRSQCAGASGLWVLFLGQGAATEPRPVPRLRPAEDGHDVARRARGAVHRVGPAARSSSCRKAPAPTRARSA